MTHILFSYIIIHYNSLEERHQEGSLLSLNCRHYRRFSFFFSYFPIFIRFSTVFMARIKYLSDGQLLGNKSKHDWPIFPFVSSQTSLLKGLRWLSPEVNKHFIPEVNLGDNPFFFFMACHFVLMGTMKLYK